jgi:hypothetical protein
MAKKMMVAAAMVIVLLLPCTEAQTYVFSLSPFVLIALPLVTVFVSFPLSLCLLFFWYVLFLFLFSLPLLCSPFFSFGFLSFSLSFFFGFSLLFLLFSMFFPLSLVFPPLVFGPFCCFYSQRMHVFSMIIKTFRIVIAGVMVTADNGRGVCFFSGFIAE